MTDVAEEGMAGVAEEVVAGVADEVMTTQQQQRARCGALVQWDR